MLDIYQYKLHDFLFWTKHTRSSYDSYLVQGGFQKKVIHIWFLENQRYGGTKNVKFSRLRVNALDVFWPSPNVPNSIGRHALGSKPKAMKIWTWWPLVILTYLTSRGAQNTFCALRRSKIHFLKNYTWWPLMTLTYSNPLRYPKYHCQAVLKISEILRYKWFSGYFLFLPAAAAVPASFSLHKILPYFKYH